MCKKLLSRTMLLLCALVAGSGSVWAEEKTSTLTFTEACGGKGTADDDVKWTVTSDGSESSFDNTKGIHYGTGSAAVKYIKLSTSDISGTITKVVVNASTASGVSATVSVTVDGSAFGGEAQSLSSTAQSYTFTGSASGDIEVLVTKASSATKALYVKSVAVTYEEGGAVESSVKKPTFSIEAGAVYYGTTVSLSQEDDKAIKYTVDGSEPTAESTTYTTPIAITSDVTIKAIAVDGSDVSQVATAAYIIKAPEAPTFSPAAGKVNAGTEVTLTAAEGCVLSYTTDGTDPADSETAVLTDDNTATITINATQTIRAIALDGGANESEEASAKYTVAVVDIDAFTASKNSFTAVSGKLNDDISFNSEQGEAGTAPGNYNDGIRLYQNGGYITLSAAEGFKITDVTISTSSQYSSTTVNYKLDDATAYAGENTTVARNSDYSIEGLNNSKVSIYCLGSDKNTRLEIAAISVTYVGNATTALASACTDGTKYYGTYSNTHAFVVPEGLTVSEVTVADGKLTVSDYAEGAVVPANTGVMISATSDGEKAIKLSGRTGASVLGSSNMLKASKSGLTAAAMTADNDNASNIKYYRLTMHDGAKIGFWWGAADGAAFAIDANKAYLAVPTTSGVRSGFSLFGDDATAIEGTLTSSDEMRGEMYNLQGQRVSKAAKGLYIVNGKKFINK